MKTALALLVGLLVHPHPLKSVVQYTLRVDSANLSGWSVEIRLRTVSDTFRLAMAAHPEYDDRYWRYVRDIDVAPRGTVTRVDSAVWQVVAPRGDVTVRYSLTLPPSPMPRAAWRPFLTATGGLVGGPHAFMYLVGAERMPVTVTVAMPASWTIASGLTPTTDPHTFSAASAAALVDSPILVGKLRVWRFVEGGLPHRIVYWPLPDAMPFDTAAFVSSVQQTVHQAMALFGRAPYREYTFLFQDGAYGALEHRNSVTIGAPSNDLGSDPHALLMETAHEFFHTWNLMAMQPSEYRDIDYRTQPPVSSLWFSEGLTMFYADLLLRRAAFQLHDSTRAAHVERLLTSYVNNPAYARFSAEDVSRVAYNAEPGALGDYSASTHLQGELIGTMLDLIIRDATHGRRSMDDVLRSLFDGAARIDGRSIERAVDTVCGCNLSGFFDTYVRNANALAFDRYLELIGLRTSITRAPAVLNDQPDRDLRLFGWHGDDDSLVHLIVVNPASIWGRAGLHSRDRLERMNGVAVRTVNDLRATLLRLRIGDTVRVEVARPGGGGPFATTVTMAGFERATVRIEPLPSASDQQRRLRDAWLNPRTESTAAGFSSDDKSPRSSKPR
jgi:predicted metalloprotease with PDZ domain